MPRFSHDGTKFLTEPDKTLLQWLRSKSDDWHQTLYALLNGKESEGAASRLKYSYIVSLSTGDYIVGNECYFLTEDVQEDTMLPRVAIGTYTSGRNRKEQIQAKEFLESIGVREVGEREQVEAILKQRYSKEAEIPDKKTHKNDLRRFISLVENDPKATCLFKDYFIFELADDQWRQPAQARSAITPSVTPVAQSCRVSQPGATMPGRPNWREAASRNWTASNCRPAWTNMPPSWRRSRCRWSRTIPTRNRPNRRTVISPHPLHDPALFSGGHSVPLDAERAGRGQRGVRRSEQGRGSQAGLSWISHKEREPSRFFSGKLFLINGLPEERRPT